MKLDQINRCPRYLPKKYVNLLPLSFKKTYLSAIEKFRMLWTRSAIARKSGEKYQTKSILYYGNWLVQTYNILSGAEKLPPADRTILENEVMQWAETNKPENFAEDFEDWKRNNVLTKKAADIKNPLNEVAGFLENL